MCLIRRVQGTQGVQGYNGLQGPQGIAGHSDITKQYIDASFYQRDLLIQNINSSLNNVAIGDSLFYSITNIPSTSTSPGEINSLAYDDTYLYVCISPNKWKRISLNDW